MISELGLTRRGSGRAVLADGRVDVFDVYDGNVEWDGRQRRVEVESANIGVLVGMGLLRNYHLKIQVVDGGAAAIELLPARQTI